MKILIIFIVFFQASMINDIYGQDVAPCYPCDPLWVRPYFYPDFNDCDSAYKCQEGVLTKFKCPTGQSLDFKLQDCINDAFTAAIYTTRKLMLNAC